MIKMLYEPFRKWSEKGGVYLMGDTHFDDPDCKLMNPNWISPEEQIKIINAVCHKNDTFVLLGDVGNPEWMKRIKAHKVLIMGNHDLGRTNYEPYFNEIYEGPLTIAPKIILSHEPLLIESDVFGGDRIAANIHGHAHEESGINDYYGQYNLTSNVVGFTPVPLSRLIKNGICASISDIHRQTIDRATYLKQRDKKTKEAIAKLPSF